ncbi:MAG: SagB/ThcOx family dehydrogenase [Candidatus Aminicenantales bacterium]
MKEGIGDNFQKETKYHRGRISSDYALRPEKSKEESSQLTKVKLEPPETEGGMPLWEAMIKRRSIRNYTEGSLTKEMLSQMLWASQGITKKAGGFGLRAAPSAGALYPVETYLGIFRVDGISPGIYQYSVQVHALEPIRGGHFGASFAKASLDQDFIASANVLFIWTAVFERSKRRYRERTYRYVYLDAGHIAQNLALAAVALGLGTCQIGALYDDEINALIGVDGVKESVIYMTSVGRP